MLRINVTITRAVMAEKIIDNFNNQLPALPSTQAFS